MKHSSGLTVSQNHFFSISRNESKETIWDEIQKGFDLFKTLDYDYDRDSSDSKNYNKTLVKFTKEKSYKSFWQKSQVLSLSKMGNSIIVESSKRSTTFKGYEPSHLPRETYDVSDPIEIVERILEIFRIVDEENH